MEAHRTPRATASSCAPAAAATARRSVLLAIGRRGTPRKLDVPGEESPKVVYRLIDPSSTAARRCWSSAAATARSKRRSRWPSSPAREVTLSYRSDAFSRVKQKNRLALEQAQRGGRLRVELESTVEAIDSDAVQLKTTGWHGDAAQRRRHRLRRRPVADAAAAADRASSSTPSTAPPAVQAGFGARPVTRATSRSSRRQKLTSSSSGFRKLVTTQ